MTSEYIAGSVNTNPVVIRRIVGMLKKGGLVVSTEGAGGGTELARLAGKITLAEVYRAVEPEGEVERLLVGQLSAAAKEFLAAGGGSASVAANAPLATK